MSDLDDALEEAHRAVSDTAALLYRARAARQHLETGPVSSPSIDPERMVCLTLVAALERELRRSLEKALGALKAARREADSPDERWLRQQFEELGE